MTNGGRTLSNGKEPRLTFGIPLSGLLCLLIVFQLLLVGQAAAQPVVTQGNDCGSWCDDFSDTSGIETYDNLEIDANGVCLEDIITWDHEYTADTEPDEIGWELVENATGDLASASGGILTLDTSMDMAHWWYRRGWNAENSIGATFEASLKVDFSYIGIKFILYDGTYYSGIIIYNYGIQVFDSGPIYYMDTTDAFHVYRLTVKNNDFMVYVDGNLIIDGTGEHSRETDGNVCTWGDYDMNPGYVGRSQWDYVSYNVQGVFPPAPSVTHSIGNLTSTEITVPSDNTWDSLFIDKEESDLDNTVKVTILDGKTYQPIAGYENLKGTDIDLSSINNTAHPTIRLKATFGGDGSATPILNEWKVTWHNTQSTQIATPPILSENNLIAGPAVVIAAAGAVILFSLTFAGSTEVGKYRLIPFISPLYSRLKKKEVLDQFTRGRIFEYIRGHPGDHYNSIKLELNINNGVLAHHLRTLERENFIKSMRDGMYKRFYPVGANIPRINGHSLYSIQGRMMEVILNRPGLTQKEVSAAMNASQQLVSYHVNLLMDSGQLKAERHGKTFRYYPI